MIKIKQFKFSHMVSLVTLLLLMNFAVEAAAYKTKSNKQNRVRVDVRPVQLLPGKPAKFEIRIMLLWERGTPRPYIINNLVRLSKGEMVGVRYNKDKDWVGGSVGFFDKNAV